MQFNEFHAGQTLHLGPVTVTQDEIIAFARDWDPQFFHTDPEAAAKSRWKGLIASGWHSCALAMRMVCEGPLKDSGSIGSPGLDYLKWTAPVRPDDRLRLQLDILETRCSGSGHIGSVHWRWQMFNQDDVLVLDTAATSLFALTATDAAPQ